jgi:hypothetical protein
MKLRRAKAGLLWIAFCVLVVFFLWLVSPQAQVNIGCGVSAGPCAVILTVPTTVSALPACTATNDGARAFVTDQATAISYRGAVTGTGGTHQAVLCSSAAWVQD